MNYNYYCDIKYIFIIAIIIRPIGNKLLHINNNSSSIFIMEIILNWTQSFSLDDIKCNILY